MAKTYLVMITVTVDDEAELAELAAQRAAEEGVPAEEWADMRKDDPIESDLQMVFDPGASPAGTSIQDCVVAREDKAGDDEDEDEDGERGEITRVS